MTFGDAAEAGLADIRRAMTADEIWAEIERRGSVETTGKPAAATLYTDMMRTSANWREDDDDRAPRFYRNGKDLFGRWGDLAPEQRKAIVASTDVPSPTWSGASCTTRSRTPRAGASEFRRSPRSEPRPAPRLRR